MNKTLLAGALLGALAGAASAQSNVTIYGVADGGLRKLTNADAAGNSRLTAGGNGTHRSNRIGFQGKEDLGNGMDVHFNLETRFRMGSGEQVGVLFNAFSYVGIGGKLGTLDIGRQYTLAYKTAIAYDPFAMKYAGVAPNTAATFGVQENNALTYTTTVGPYTARALYAVGEQAGSSRNGATQALGLNYASGALDLGGAYTRKNTVAGLERDHATLGAGYKFGAFRATAGHARQREQVPASRDTVTTYSWAGLQYNWSPVVAITGAYYRTTLRRATAPASGERDFYILSATYSLSKRSLLYMEADHVSMRGSLVASGQTTQDGVSAGINFIF